MTHHRTRRNAVSRSVACGCAMVAVASSLLGCQRSSGKWNEAFHRSEGWWYSDGGSSAVLANGKTVWFFGDTWLRHNPNVLSNSMAVQDTELGRAPGKDEIRFFGRDDTGALLDVTKVGEFATRSWVEPRTDDGQRPRTWFWPSAGLSVDGRLIATYIEVGCVKGEFPACRVSLANMDFMGHAVVEVDNPTDDPERWNVGTTPLVDRRGQSPSAHRLHWGSALIADGGWLYVFGTALNEKSQPEDVKVARVLPKNVSRYDLWQFLTPRGWQMVSTGPFPVELQSLARGGATELSVQRVVRDGQSEFVMVQVDPVTQDVVVRSSPASDIESIRWSGPEAGTRVRRFSLPSLDPDTAGGMNWSGHSHTRAPSQDQSLLVSYFSERVHSLRFVELPLSQAVGGL